MNEHTTTALVLQAKPSGELDAIVTLFTEALGKVEARATSSRKITSKLAGHLQPLHLVRVRLAHKNGFRIADALTIRTAPKTPRALELLRFVNAMTAPLAPDPMLWRALHKTLQNPDLSSSHRVLLTALGFDARFAECGACGSRPVRYFSEDTHSFFCLSCGKKIKKQRPTEDAVIEIGSGEE